MKYIFCILASVLIMASCASHPDVPNDYTQGKEMAKIYPDYVDVTVPVNIAPLHFTVDTPADEYVVRLSAGTTSYTYGQQALPSESEWKSMVEEAKDGSIKVEIFVTNNGKWTLTKPFDIHVSADEIDPYISYRLIAPSYVTYENLTINQRNLTNYDETLIYGNMINSDEEDGQCINCHSYQSYNPERMQFHCRQALGGTVVAYDGKVEKRQIKHLLKAEPGDTMPGSGVYPAWHPTERLIAYSSNHTGQSFHTVDLDKIEVQDTYSDLILYDLDANNGAGEVIALERDTMDLDCYPFWSPDGKYLYYCSANYQQQDSAKAKEYDMIVNYKEVRYNLYRRSFDLAKRTFGEREMVYNAEADSMSATLPRISPDGEWLMFTRGSHGVFHIWHRDADLWLKNLRTGEMREAKELNSHNVESYHAWSSNGKWVIFSSRRTDGNFTRPFIAHVEKDGHFGRPFELPQDDPEYHRQFLRSYNIPEFMTGPVTISPQEFGDAIRKE